MSQVMSKSVQLFVVTDSRRGSCRSKEPQCRQCKWVKNLGKHQTTNYLFQIVDVNWHVAHGSLLLLVLLNREIRSRRKEWGHESSRDWQLQVSKIKFSERNLLIGPFLHSTPNNITISFRHLTCHGGGDLTSHGGGGPLENQEACPFKYPGW